MKVKQQKGILSWGVTIALFAFLAICFDMLYCLNDDLMIQSILSGAYSGVPSKNSVYLASPLSDLLSGFYQGMPNIPWLGLFFAFCYFVCFGTILYQSMMLTKTKKEMWVTVVLSFLFFFAVLLDGYLMLHYTVVAAVMGGTGLFLLFTVSAEPIKLDISGKEEEKEKKNRNKVVILAVVFLLFCFLIRSKVFYLMLPFLAVTGLSLLLEQNGKKAMELVRSILPAILFFGFCFAVFWGIGQVMYQKGEWKSYSDYNDARTEVYDYVGIHQSKEALSYYESLGITEEEIALYLSYNVLLEENNSTERMQQLASYKAEAQSSPMDRIKEALITYKARTLQLPNDTPYQYIALVLYGIVPGICILKKEYRQMIPVFLCGVFRSVLWIYLIYNGRYPERVTMSIFIMEFAVLFGILMRRMHCKKEKEETVVVKNVGLLVLVILALVFLWGGAVSGKKAMEKQELQLAINSREQVIYDYMEAHPEAFYLLDVYATVNRTEYALRDYHGGYENYLLLGGWMTESPLTKAKLEREGYANAMEAFTLGENVYLVVKRGTGRTIEVLCDRYQWEAERLLLIEEVEAQDVIFEIYSFVKE